jgi:UDP:flavonoid glycosyltransferase YjiC (YdhE family)
MTDASRTPASILFRADGDAAIGSGHLRRCLALADRLREWGYECLFVCRASPQSFNGLIRDAGFDLVELPGSSSTITGSTRRGNEKRARSRRVSW